MSILSDAVSISIVGTRKASQNGLNAAREIAYGLALKNAVVISGGALGIDSEAHKGALNGRGKTIAILPCGLEYPYLMDNAILRREIVDFGGALVTEYPMHTPVQRGAFQVRNRLISGMAHGVLIAEAPKKSGALITAKHALEQNREVFVFIGEDEKAFSGCIALEEDGAARIYTAEDVLKPFASRRRQERIEQLARTAENISHVSRVRPKIASLSDTEKEPEIAEKKPAEPIPALENNLLQNVSEDAKVVYAALNDTPKHASELELELGMSTGKILAALTELELFGLIKTYPGQRFTKA